MESINSTASRFEPFGTQRRLQRMFGVADRSLDLYAALEEGHIILVNLSTEGAQIDKETARLLGTVLLADLWVSAQQRGKASDRSGLRPFHVYIDEVQNFITPTLAEDLDQASGFGLRLILAHQFPSQLSGASEHGARLLRSLMTNARSKVVFGGIGSPEDLGPLVDYMYMGALDIDEIKHMQFSTKVMEYREEMRTTYAHTEGKVDGGGDNRNWGKGAGTQSPFHDPGVGMSSQFVSETRGDNSSWSDIQSDTVLESMQIIPVLGREITSPQFRSLEEQRYRAMAAMFDQEQRHFLARLPGMSEPVSAFTPFLEPGVASKARVDRFIAESYAARWPGLALPVAEVDRLLAGREAHFDTLLTREPFGALGEPRDYRRLIEPEGKTKA